MKKLLYQSSFILTAFLILYSCSPEEETKAPTSTVQSTTPEPEPETPAPVVVQYTLTVTANEGGSVTNGGTYDEGTELTITATPEEGYEFVRWEGSDSSENSLIITLNGDETISALFEVKLQYTLIVTAGHGGTVSSNGGTFNQGEEVVVSAISDNGWRFKKWSNGNYYSQYDLIINDSIIINAEFEELPTDLISFYSEKGGRDTFHPNQVLALETLLFVQEDIDNNNLEQARERLDHVFSLMPLSDNMWFEISHQTNSTDSHCMSCPINIGGPVAYYGLRMLDQIVSYGNPANEETLELTAVVAACAQVTRPQLPNLTPETIYMDISPKILENDGHILKISTSLFRKWIQTITGGSKVNLNIYLVEDCVDVDYTDDGKTIFSGVTDLTSLINKVPLELAEKTDIWWTIAPSGVPGDGSGFNRHFITGGMSGYRRNGDDRYNRPLILSDDAWFLRKPEHMGLGDYHDIELKAYQPQYFQHELMHYLFAIWSQFDLEYLNGPNQHAWFDRNRWPSDFEGMFEPDYYSETITKRLINATPSLRDGLKFPGSPSFALLDSNEYVIEDTALLIGNYRREPVENGYHEVEIISENGSLKWRNASGVSWSLEIRDGKLWSGPDCVYGEQILGVFLENNQNVLALVFNNENYERVNN